MKGKTITAAVATGLLYFASPSEAQENRLDELASRIYETESALADSTIDGLGRAQAERDLEAWTAELDSLQLAQLPQSKSRWNGIIGASAGQSSKGLEVGVQHGSFALVGNYNMGSNETSEKVDGPTSNTTGMQGQVSTRNTGYNALGIGLEYHPEGNPLFIGAGANKWTYDKTKEVKITRRDGTVKRDSELESRSNVSGKAYLGFKRDLSGNSSAGLTAGYDSQKGFFAGLRLNRRLGR